MLGEGRNSVRLDRVDNTGRKSRDSGGDAGAVPGETFISRLISLRFRVACSGVC